MAWKHRDPWTRAPYTLALEPRIMFDAAGAATYADVVEPLEEVPPASNDPELRVEIVFIDERLAGEPAIRDAFGSAEVVVLARDVDGLDQIAAALAGRSDIDAVHVLSHGSEGLFRIGATTVDRSVLQSRADVVAAIGTALAPDGDILLYGCRIGAGEAGALLLEELAMLTGADVAASTDDTGAASLGGDWDLEIATGAIAQSFAIDFEMIREFEGLLPQATLTFDGLGFTAGQELDNQTYTLNGQQFELFVANASGVKIALPFSAFGASVLFDDNARSFSFSTNVIGDGGAVSIFSQNQNGGWPTDTINLVFKTTDSSDFSFESFKSHVNYNGAYGNFITVEGLRDGVSVGVQNATLNSDTAPFFSTVSMTNAAFQFVDEIRIRLDTTAPGYDAAFPGLYHTFDTIVVGDAVAPNAAPVVDLNGAPAGVNFAASYTENGTPAAIAAATATVSDADGDAITSFSATLTNPVAGDRLTLTGTYGTITGANIAGSGTSAITITGSHSAADVTAALRAITFSSTSDAPTAANRTVQVVVNDGTVNSAVATTTVSVTEVNDAPTLAATGGTPTFTEGDAAPGADLFSGVTVSTVEAGQTIIGLTLTVSNVADGASEILRIGGVDVALTNGNSVAVSGGTAAVSVVSGVATVALSGVSLTTAATQTIVDGLAYRNTSDAPSTADRVATITQIRDSGGVASGGADTATPNIAATVTVVAVNDAPTLTGGGNLPAVDEDTANPAGAALSALGIAASDVDGTVTGYAIVGNSANAATQGVWQYSTNGGTNWFAIGAVADDSTALALSATTLVRFVPVPDFNGAPAALTIRAVDSSYLVGFSTTVGTEVRVAIDTTVAGGSSAISGASATIVTTITAVNDDPTATGVPASASFTEDTAGNLDLSGISFGDVDSGANAVDFVLAANAGTLAATSGGGVAVGGSGTGTLTLTGTAANIDTYLNTASNIQYTPAANANGSGAATITLTADDGGNTGTGGGGNVALGTIQIDIAAVNDAPLVTTSGGSAAYVENAASVPIDPALTVSDVDSGTLAAATVSITGSFQAGQDVLAFVNDGATMGDIAATYDAAAGVLSLTSAGGATPTQWQAALRAVTFANGSEDPSTATRTVSFAASDGAVTSLAATRTVTVTAVNDAPTANPAFGYVNTGVSTETSGLITLTSAMLNEGDPDDLGGGVTYTITTAVTAGILFRDANGNGSVDGGETLGTGATFTQADIDLGRIKYLHGGGASTSDSFVFDVRDGGEDGSTPLTGETFTITIAARPVLAIGGGAPAHVEDAGATIVAANLTVTDTDSPNLAGATVTITDFVTGDQLLFTNQNGITGTYDGAGVLTLAGNATQAQYRDALRSVAYSTTNDDPATGVGNSDRVIAFRVTDGGLQSTAVTQTVGVENANDAPVLDPSLSPALTGILENLGPPANGSTAGSTLVSALTGGVSDVDDGALRGIAVIDVSAQGTLWFTTNGGATWAQVGAVSDPNARLLADDGQTRLYFQPADDVNGTIADAATFRAWDRTSGSNGGLADTTTNGAGTAFSIATDTAAIAITAVNDAPVLTLPTTIGVTEDVPSPLTGISVFDVDAGAAPVTVTLTVGSGSLAAANGAGVAVGGTTSSRVLTGSIADINAFIAAGNVIFTTASDATANVSLSVAVNDAGNTGVGGPLTDTGSVTLVVTAVDDPPVLGGLALGQAVTDKTTIAPFTGATVDDVDSAAVTVTVRLDTAAKGSFTTLAGFTDAGAGVYTFTGVPAAAQTALRALVFTPAENRVTPGATETTTFTVEVAEAASTVSGTASVVSTSVNDAPTTGGSFAGQGALDTGTVSPFAAATVGDPDAGQPLTVTVTLDDFAKGAFTAASLAATGFVSGGAGVYTLVAPDASVAQAALRALVFAPTANRVAPGLAETTGFTVAVSDGSAPVVVDATTSVVSTSVNDAPVATRAIPDQPTRAGQPFGLVLPAGLFADPDVGQTVSMTVENLPAGLVFDAATRTISGVIATPIVGSVALRVVGTDDLGAMSVVEVRLIGSSEDRVDDAPPPVTPTQTGSGSLPAPIPPPSTPIQFVPDALPPPEDFGGIGGGGITDPTPPPETPYVPPREPVFPAPGFFVSPPQAGDTPGFAIRTEAFVAPLSVRSGTGPISFALPPSTFVVEYPGIQVLVGATLADGSPLPAWVTFDPATGTFVIDAPPGFTGELNVLVSATLPTGESASTVLRIELTPGEETGDDADGGAAPGEEAPQQDGVLDVRSGVDTASLGKPSVNEAIRSASRGVWATQGADLIASLIAALPDGRHSGELWDDSRNGKEAA